MISYTQVNRDYRQDYLKKLKTGEKQISSYPNNINFVNFFYFLRAPTFVYEETYPRTSKFKIKYFILKVLKAFFNITLMYYIYTEHIEITIPVMLTTSIFELIIRLYFPICLWCFFTFYLIFECVLPAYAELATFGDRLFYDDWWNSTDLEEFNRRWNKIVHQFLHRHVYLECLNYYKLSATASKLLTFIFSALLHEYCLCIVIKLFRPYMFLLMMIQLPILAFGKKYLKNTTGGNFFFWYSVLIGNCLIFILYNTAYLLENGHN
jgi:sterol O-acyltransferase